MRYFFGTCLVAITLAAFVIGCGSDATPHPVNVKPDSRIQRIGEGGGANSQSNQNKQALP
jgi:hypothetical protein